ncbi:hypothetical protein N657DRAFT_295311 [Parathielavia appendiculata]|uniref:Uncharacterized protein n=1 Tax=Parathielavia appendiculata TaxID=2587402 RepID=A0AAN6U470_9PEZI|nr:hypothetical protein N657DRAFT_295311 [Parathielavia appendiculata]
MCGILFSFLSIISSFSCHIRAFAFPSTAICLFLFFFIPTIGHALTNKLGLNPGTTFCWREFFKLRGTTPMPGVKVQIPWLFTTKGREHAASWKNVRNTTGQADEPGMSAESLAGTRQLMESMAYRSTGRAVSGVCIGQSISLSSL